jgi:hypothetical protein
MDCLAIRYYCTLAHKGRNFLKGFIENELCVLCLYVNISENFHILRRTERDMIKIQTEMQL